jgi:hypothetical protein
VGRLMAATLTSERAAPPRAQNMSVEKVPTCSKPAFT